MPRHLRLLLPAMALLLATACSTVALLAGDSLTFSQQQIQQRLADKFPRDYSRLGGLVTVRLMNPRLSIPAGQDRLRMDLDVALGALGSPAQVPDGSLTLTSALRYDPATRGLHLAQPRIEDARLARVGADRMNENVRTALNDWLAEWAREEPVYRLDNNVIGRIGARRIQGTTIGDGRVVVHLGN